MTIKKRLYNWLKNVKLATPVIIAFAGLLIGSILFGYPHAPVNAMYYNLSIKNMRQLTDSVLSRQEVLLKTMYDSLTGVIRNTDTCKDKSLAQKKQKLEEIRLKLSSIIHESNELNFFNKDTGVNYYFNYISSDRDSFSNQINRLEKKDSILIPAIVKNDLQTFSTFPEYRPTQLLVTKQKTSQTYLTTINPSFGFWFFISVAQLTMWMLLICLTIGVATGTNSIIPELPYNKKNFLKFTLLPLFLLGLFAWIIYMVVVDDYIIKDYYLLKGFNNKMVYYSIIGYMTAGLCFGTYMFFLKKIELVNLDVQVNNLSITGDPDKAIEIKKLFASFNMVFLFSAVILSVFVIWVGMLIKTINDTEIFKYYTKLSGQPFITFDYIYLIGLLHTVLLLIFYIPVRLKFNSLKITVEIDKTNTINEKNKKLLSTFWSILSTVIITASPLLTSVIQKIIENFK